MIISRSQHDHVTILRKISDNVTWLCWLWEIVIDFPQTLSLGYVGYGKLSLIFLRICHVVILVMGNYH
jgi:hypothetical protein